MWYALAALGGAAGATVLIALGLLLCARITDAVERTAREEER